MRLKEIKLTGLSITGSPNGSETLHIGVAAGEGDKEMFYSREMSTNGTLTLEHLAEVMKRIVEVVNKES
jgi:hypothetical protein